MGRGGCFLTILAIGLVCMGGQGTYTAVTNWSPTEMTCAEYIQKRPKASWLNLKDCELSLLEAAYMEKYGKIEELYVPVRPKDSKDDHIMVVLAVKDRSMISTMQSLKNLDPKKALENLVQNHDKLMPTRDIKGLVRFGMDLKEEDRRKIASLDSNLDKNFVIVDENKEPALLVSLLMLAGGLGLGGFMIAGKKS